MEYNEAVWILGSSHSMRKKSLLSSSKFFVFKVWKKVSGPGDPDGGLFSSSSSACLCCSVVQLRKLFLPVNVVRNDCNLAWCCCVIVDKLLNSYIPALEK